MIRKLPWDSHFFDLIVGESHFNIDSNTIDYSDYDLLYIISDQDFELKIEGFTNSHSEQRIKFRKVLQSEGQMSQNVYSHKEVDYQIDDIFRLAYESGKHSRFLLDTNFAAGKFEELYRQWITNSISNDFADDLLLYIDQGKIIGLVSYSTSDKNASVGLIAVDPNQQGKGIGGILLAHLEAVLFENGIESLTIPTQRNNQQACRFYERKGYNISEENVIKHYWKD